MPYADSDGVRIYYEEEGRGDPVLLIMGLGYTLDMWHRIRPRLSESYRVIAFDNRGVGRSDVPEPPYSVRGMAGDAVAVLDAVGVERTHVVGLSMGSVIAQELALSFPDRVRSLVLGAAACGGPDAVVAEEEVLVALAARAEMSPEDGIRATLEYTYDPATPEERIDEDLAIRLRTYPTPKGYLAQLEAVLGYDTSARLKGISVPALVIHGRSDRLVPLDNAADVARRIEGSRLVVLDGASHILFTDQPERSSEVILGFLDELSAPVTTTGGTR